MNRYFMRVSSLSLNKELPMRIRFMLLDVIDLRENNVSTFYMCVLNCTCLVGLPVVWSVDSIGLDAPSVV